MHPADAPRPLPESPAPPRTLRLLAWLGLLYVSSGLPYGLVNKTAPVLYRAKGIDLGSVGLLTLAGLPWTLKFIWAPALDRFGTRLRWVLCCQVALVAALVAFAMTSPSSVTTAAWACLLVVAMASATQDVALDAYAIDAVPAGLVGPANSVRVSAYKLAFLTGSSLLIGFADALSWSGVWIAAATAFALLAAASPFAPRAPRHSAAGQPILEPFARLVGRRGIWVVALFVLLFKLGDQAMAPMTRTALLDRGFTTADIGFKVTWVEAGALVLGAAAGGLLTRRWGVFRALWVLGALQAVSNLAYAYAVDHGRTALWAAAAIEPFCGGLGAAPFLSFLMLSCEKRHAAAHYAIWTALMGLAGIAAGSLSGYATEEMGYAGWFATTFALAVPAFALLPFARRWLDDRAAERATEGAGATG